MDWQFSIRPARAVDAEAIARVHVQSWRETYRGLMSDHILDGRTVEDRTPLWEMALSGLTPRHVFLVLSDPENDREIAGFAYGGPARDLTPGYSGEIYAMYLLHQHQGKGLGRALFGRLRDGLREVGLGDFFIMVVVGNRSRGFFMKMGAASDGFGQTTLRGRRGGQQRIREERLVWR